MSAFARHKGVNLYVRWVIAIGILFVACGVYINTLHGSFLIDDYFFIDRPGLGDPKGFFHLFIESVLPWHKESSLFRPIPVLSMAIQIFFSGKNPIPFHAVNIILHMIVTGLVMIVTKKIFKNTLLALVSGVLFAVLPIHTEAVANIKSRDELFATAFALCSWIVFLYGQEESKNFRKKCIYMAGSALLLFFGMASKEFIVCIWGLFLFISIRMKKISLRNSIIWIGTYCIPFLVYILLRYIALGSSFLGDDIHITSNPLKFAHGWTLFWTPFSFLWIYVSKTLVPIVLSATYHVQAVSLVFHGFASWETMVGICIFVSCVWLIVWKKTSQTPLGIGVLVFLYLYLPFSQFFFRGGDMIAERWMYLPSIGILWALAWGITLCMKKNYVIGFGIAMLFIGAYGYRTIDRNTVWRSPEALYTSMIHDSPHSMKGYANMAYYVLEQGYYDDAEKYAQKALSLYSEYAPMYGVLASVAYQKKEYGKAEAFMEKGLHIDPESIDMYHNYARILYIKNEYPKALQSMQIYISGYPITPKVGDRILYAMLLSKNRKFTESLSYIESQLSGDTQYPEVRFLLAVNNFFLGHPDIAEHYMTWQKNRSIESMRAEILSFPLGQ